MRLDWVCAADVDWSVGEGFSLSNAPFVTLAWFGPLILMDLRFTPDCRSCQRSFRSVDSICLSVGERSCFIEIPLGQEPFLENKLAT